MRANDAVEGCCHPAKIAIVSPPSAGTAVVIDAIAGIIAYTPDDACNPALDSLVYSLSSCVCYQEAVVNFDIVRCDQLVLCNDDCLECPDGTVWVCEGC